MAENASCKTLDLPHLKSRFLVIAKMEVCNNPGDRGPGMNNTVNTIHTCPTPAHPVLSHGLTNMTWVLNQVSNVNYFDLHSTFYIHISLETNVQNK